MKLNYLLLAGLLCGAGVASAQKSGFDYKFYGQVRTDLFYNSRSNSESVDGLFYMYPKDEALDAAGNDLNAQADGNFYTMYSRVGVDVNGPEIGKGIKTSAKLEVDFRGSGTSYYMLRLRHVYFNLAWKKSSLLVGQTWHPFYGEVAPDILNLNMGAPYQPFSRAPQIRYRYNEGAFQLQLAALWQSQYLSVGPASNNVGETATQKSQRFIKNGCVPELALNLDYKANGWIAGGGIDMTSIVPRTQSNIGGKTYKVDERITSISAEAHVSYKNNGWLVAAKSVYGSNFTQASGVGGYGIVSFDQIDGSQEYTPVRVSSTWLNVAYGSKWRPAVMVGYLKNLGCDTPVSGVLGTGVSDGLDQLVSATAELTYNLPNWKFGVEYMLCNAFYGDLTNEARVENTHSVMNHRFVATAIFQF